MNWTMTPAKARTGTGKITSDWIWRVLGLFQVADGFILGLKNFCRDGKSHHGAIANSDADFLVLGALYSLEAEVV